MGVVVDVEGSVVLEKEVEREARELWADGVAFDEAFE